MEKTELNLQVTLKNLSREDLDDFYVWASDSEVARYMTWEAYTNKDDALEFLIKIAEPHPYFKAICYNGKVVGSLTLMPGKGSNSCRAELGYVLARKYWGKGITSTAIKKALYDGFHSLSIHRIEALVDPDNIASQRVLEKSGMTREGLLKSYLLFKGKISDRYMYSITQ